MEKFDYRHRDWTAAADKDLLHSEVMQCLKETKDSLDVQVKDNVIYAEVEPEHLIEDLLARFLLAQFPEYSIVLESSRGTFTTGKNVAGVVRTRTNKEVLIKKLSSKSKKDINNIL